MWSTPKPLPFSAYKNISVALEEKIIRFDVLQHFSEDKEVLFELNHYRGEALNLALKRKIAEKIATQRMAIYENKSPFQSYPHTSSDGSLQELIRLNLLTQEEMNALKKIDPTFNPCLACGKTLLESILALLPDIEDLFIKMITPTIPSIQRKM